MASVTTRSTGGRFITFMCGDGARRSVSLGSCPKRFADAVKVKIEELVAAKAFGHAPSNETVQWLKSIDEWLYAKLVAVDLVPPRCTVTVQVAVDRYIAERAGRLKPESLKKLRQSTSKLLAFVDGDRQLRHLTHDDATEVLAGMEAEGLSRASIRTHGGNIKAIFNDAVKRREIPESPFEVLESGPTASTYRRYITPEDISRVLRACSNAEMRLLVGLARYAGLRHPSETSLLAWSYVDRERGRLRVQSPKTERFEGHAERLVPIEPRLMRLLDDWRAMSDSDDGRVFAMNLKHITIRRMRPICERAGVEPWARFWQTLRSSCEIEWAKRHPQYVVSLWIGHSLEVSGRHYVNAVPDEIYAQAASHRDERDEWAGADSGELRLAAG